MVEFLGFSMQKIILSVNRDNFTVFPPICMPFIYFSCLISLARTSSTMLNRSGESGQLVFFLIIEESLSKFHHWVWCYLGMSHMAYIVLRYSLYTQFVEILSWIDVEFCQMLFCASIAMIMLFLSFILLMWFIRLFISIWWTIFTYQEWISLITVYDTFNVMLTSVYKYFVEYFYIYIHQY